MRRPTIQDLRTKCALALVATVVMHLVLTQWVVLIHGAKQFRLWGEGDQLGYMAMVADVIHGNFDRVEPITLTGVNTYPRFYFLLAGLVGRSFGWSAPTAWNVVGLMFQCVLIGSLGLLLQAVSRRWWFALLAPLVPITGVCGWLLSGTWNVALGTHHSTLWAWYGTLGALNGESAGIAVQVTALSLLGIAWLAGLRSGMPMFIGGALLLGAVAQMETYAFIVGVWFAAAVAATYAVYRWGNSRTRAVQLVLVVALYVTGPIVNAAVGQLPTLVYGLLPTMPGLWLIYRAKGRIVPMCIAAVALGSAPQIVTTLLDLVRRDPFLTYRVASNHDLGVVHMLAVPASGVVVVPLLVMCWLGRRAADPVRQAIPTAALGVFLVAATNDVWGANAEPYRFWIECFGLCAISVLLCLALAIKSADCPRVAWLVPALCFAVALPDLFLWWGDSNPQRTWDKDNSHSSAIVASLAPTGTTSGSPLVMLDQCLDPQSVKVLTGAPIAYYRLGMAWPANRDAIDKVLTSRSNHSFTAEDTRAAGIGWALVDTNCYRKMRPDLERLGASRVNSLPYVGSSAWHSGGAGQKGNIELWQLPR